MYLVKKNKLNKIITEYKKNNLPIKLHIGCGILYKDEWINIDNNSDNNIKKLDLNWDISKNLPLTEASVDYIYNEHFIEHLTYVQGQNFLKNAFKILKHGGVARIACPDLDYLINGYIENNWREQDWVTKYNCQWIKSRCEMINICLNISPWGHQYVYNREDLTRALTEAGFRKENIYEVEYSKSKYKDLQNLETRKDSIIFEALK